MYEREDPFGRTPERIQEDEDEAADRELEDRWFEKHVVRDIEMEKKQ